MKLRTLVKKAECKGNELFTILQNIEKQLVFCGFKNTVPHVLRCNNNDIILEYNGSEIDIQDAIQIMEKVGYITKEDFMP